MKFLSVLILLVSFTAEARFSTKASSCPGSSSNCNKADADAWNPPAGGGWLCCAYYPKIALPTVNPILDSTAPNVGSGVRNKINAKAVK